MEKIDQKESNEEKSKRNSKDISERSEFKNSEKRNVERAKRGRIDHNPSMKHIDLEIEVENLGPRIKTLFAEEIKIAKENFESRFQVKENENDFENIKNIEIRQFFELDLSLTNRAYLLNPLAEKCAHLSSNFKIDLDIPKISKFGENVAKEEISINELKFLFFPKFSNEFRNQKFRLVNYIMSLLKSDNFWIKMADQIDLFQKIKLDFEESVNAVIKSKQINLSDEDKMINDDILGLSKIKYRFGQTFKSIFQGHDFDYVIRAVYLLSNFKRNLIKYTFDLPTESFFLTIKLSGRKFSKLEDLVFSLIEKIQVAFQLNLLKLFNENLISKYPFADFLVSRKHENGIEIIEMIITKQEIIKIGLEELKQAFNSQIFEAPLNIEFLEESLFFWIFNNIVNREYCPYIYCLRHLAESLLDLNAALLNLKNCQNLDLNYPDSQNFRAANIVKFSKSETIIFKFKMLTEKKKYFEYKYDLISLIIKYNLSSFGVESLNDIFKMLENFNSSKIRDDIIVDYDHFKKNHFQMYSCFKKILKYYLSQMLTFKQSKTLFEFLNKRENIILLKRFDNSRLIAKFKKLNGMYLEYLKSQNNGDSLYFLYKKQLAQEVNLRSEIETIMAENIYPFEFYEINQVELLKDHLLHSESVRLAYIKKLQEEMLVLGNTVCFSNIKNYWANINEYINELLKEHDRVGLNGEVPANLRFYIKDKKHLILEEKLKNEAKGYRRVKPELIFDISDWDFIGPLISQMHWKVQNGIFTWYCIFVANFPYRKLVLEILEGLGIKKVKSRVTSIKFFNIISKFFKFLDDAKSLDGFHNFFSGEKYYSIPYEIMIDLDNAFGLSDTTKQENILWDKDFFEHLHEWMNRNTGELLYDIDITKDFELFMDHLFSDLAKTTSLRTALNQNEKTIYIEPSYFSEKESMLFGMFNYLPNKNKIYFFKNNEEQHKGNFSYKTFAEFASNFFNFSAEGSAQSFKVKLRETDELKDEKSRNFDNYLSIKNKFKGANNEEDVEDKAKTVSKTICFAVTGESLPKIMYWVYGPNYQPRLNLHIKKEPKKLRHVINADLTSFVKQTYIHDWLVSSLNQVNKSKINSLLDNRERLICFHKLKSTSNGEKWCIPIDLKDFHQHFGKTHFDSFCRIIQEKMRNSILCEFIKEDFEHILSTMSTELSSGKLQFIFKSEEEGLFSPFAVNKSDCWVKAKKLEPKKEGLPASFAYDLTFKVNNGLMSGWKLTSLFGSLFNLTLNHMSEFFNVALSSDLVSDLNVLGDDTHFKRRFLASGLNHISFINMINKIAHPDKQIISTVTSEFLKKKINTVTGKIHYSNVRTLTTLLFQKENVKRLLNDKNFIKDNLDLWNLFLIRVEKSEIVENVLRKKYFQKFFENLMNFKRNEKISEIEKLINSPTFFVGFLPGPLRSFQIDFSLKQSDINSQITNYNIIKSTKIYELDVEPGHCKGILANVSKIVGGLKDKVANAGQLMELQRRLVLAETEEIVASTGEYFDCAISAEKNLEELSQRKAYLNFEKIEDGEETLVYGERNQEFDIGDFLEFSKGLIKLAVLGNRKFSGVIGELVYHNENISNVICNELRSLGEFEANFHFIISAFKNLKKQTDLENLLTHKYINKFDKHTFLKLALSNKHAISVSRNYVHDEIIGFLNFYLSKFVIFYIIEKSEIDPSQIEKFLTRINISLDYYLHQQSDGLIADLEGIINEKLKEFHDQ